MERTPTYGGVPQGGRRRWPRILGVAVLALACLLVAGVATGLIRVYDAAGNAGVAVGVDCHNLGYEWRGETGFFADACS